MKKIRTCPFGYWMENGVYKVVPEESRLIQEIFVSYLNGASLKQLSDMAEKTGLKFRENAAAWNKNIKLPITTAGNWLEFSRMTVFPE